MPLKIRPLMNKLIKMDFIVTEDRSTFTAHFFRVGSVVEVLGPAVVLEPAVVPGPAVVLEPAMVLGLAVVLGPAVVLVPASSHSR